ncbi:hypothetical protein Poli38472_013904 [Pythium oligandrum]|uniref:Tryptophan synthase beta chain-like PALP domain-containing protein n=1 Tax=Pythium oligandrum TaxID=41045 RepID=A0A8K1FD34_PYTOL|nr:hypothetical protein Poli38472_013904 [Pythium oligandrum]|eukprot:TMW55142.1 hypothetical protein Poli38472_013904 [Pythium oligandrum]
MTETYAISLESIQAAAERIRGLAHRTPVLTCQTLDAMATQARGTEAEGDAVRMFFKCENMQKVGAFKYRGALNAVKKALETKGDQATSEPLTFLTHSSGNHAQAVALAARDTNCRAVIVMPDNAPVVKRNAVQGYGAQVVTSASTVTAREEVAAEWVARTNGCFVHPSDDPEVMSGQGTASLELLEQVNEQWATTLDAVVVPVGGGGLCSGTAMAVKSVNPSIKVFGIEPAGAADAYASFKSRELRGHDTPPQTIADGLRTTLGDNNFPVIRDHVDEIVLVSEDEILSTMKLMWERMKIVVEPSGAVAAASVLFNKLPLGDGERPIRNIGVLISGGNVDLDNLPWGVKL